MDDAARREAGMTVRRAVLGDSHVDRATAGLMARPPRPVGAPVLSRANWVRLCAQGAVMTVGSLVAFGGLGNLIKDGVLTNFRAELLTASVLCVVLAVLLDVVLVVAQRLMTPWTRA